MIYSFYSFMAMLAAAFIIPLASIKSERYAPAIAVPVSIAAFLLALATIPGVIEHGILTHQMEGWAAPAGITIAVDGLGMLSIAMITFIGFLVTLFSLNFIGKRKAEYYSLLCLMQAGLLGIAHTGDIFNLFVFLEITSLSSYLLVSYYKSAKSLEAGIKSLIIGSLSTSLFFLGTILLYGLTGTLNMADLALKLASLAGPAIPVSLALLITGMGIKAVVFPFYAWKPDAVTAAPAPVGAMLSSLSAFIGIYAILRIVFTVFSGYNQTIYWVFIALGVITMVLGALLAMQQRNLLRLLAYSAISQVGYIFLAFGVGGFVPAGLDAAIFHMLNVALIEALLFLSAGAVIHRAGSSDMAKMGGTRSSMLSFCFLAGMLANAGIPLLNGFASKWMIYLAALEVSPILTVIAVVVSVLTLMYGLKAYSIVFLGTRNAMHSGLPRSMIAPIILLAAICIILGILPQLGFSLADYVSNSLNNIPYIEAVLNG